MKTLIMAALGVFGAIMAPEAAMASVLDDVRAAARQYAEPDKERAEAMIAEKAERLALHRQHRSGGENCDCSKGSCTCPDGDCQDCTSSECTDCEEMTQARTHEHSGSQLRKAEVTQGQATA